MTHSPSDLSRNEACGRHTTRCTALALVALLLLSRAGAAKQSEHSRVRVKARRLAENRAAAGRDGSGPGNPPEPEDAEDFDLVVVGGGSGGLACAQEAARLGKRVAVCDFVAPSAAGTTWGLGGTCVNVGCIPKKLMHQASLLGENLQDAREYGWEVELPEGHALHTWERLVENVQMHIKSLNFGYKAALMSADVDYINARAELESSSVVRATDVLGRARTLRAGAIVLATGGRPRYLDNVPGGRDLVITSDDLFSLPTPPGKTLCIGGGYVSLECAGLLHGLGHDVHVLLRSLPLRGFDRQMAESVLQDMQSRGCRVTRGAVPVSFEAVDGPEGGRRRVRATWREEDGQERSEEFDTVLVAVGRDAQTRGLGLDRAGVQCDPRTGKILVEGECTAADGVYAIGDVVEGAPELTPVAIQAGRLLARRLFAGAEEAMDYAGVPTTVFTPLEYACVGLSEEAAVAKYGEGSLEIFHAYYKPLEWTLPHRPDNACYAKVICEGAGDQRVLGLHVLGPGAGEMIQGFAVALKVGCTKADLDRTVGVHPTNAEELLGLRITKRSGEDARKTGC